MTAGTVRVAAAPVSWGVCEVEGWGWQPPRDEVLQEMVQLGLGATEIGPPGFLPEEPPLLRAALNRFRLAAVAGFVTTVLHTAECELDVVEAAGLLLAGAGAETMVLAAAAGPAGYERRASLDHDDWSRLLRNLEVALDICTRAGLRLAVHPHVGTAIEQLDHVARVLAESTVGLCLDTGHLRLGGGDPAELARRVPDRVLHVHLKDVNAGLAARFRCGAIPYRDAVRRGLYVPLGEGNAEIAQVVAALTSSGYRGWYVIEQDRVLTDAPGEVDAASRDAGTSIAFLDSTAT